MKKLIVSLSLFFSFSTLANAQWTTSGTITSTTNSVGIGTATPTSPLDVKTTTNGTIGINLTNNSTGSAARTRITLYNDANYALINLNGTAFPTDPNSLLIHAPLTGGGSLIFGTAATERVRVTNMGNVGIGTNSPTTTLDVNGTFKAGSGGNVFSFNGTDLVMQVPSRGTGGRALVADVGNTLTINYNGDFTGGTRIGTKTFLAETNTGISYINTGGLAVGTTDPRGFMLAVAGSAIATSVTVKTIANWPDYVFKKNYQLPSLSAVKKYIDQNQHLPEVPSEQQITKDGLNLGEMNKLLMKKVEELTLYLIQKEEQLKKQQVQIERQLQMQELQEKRLQKLEQMLTSGKQ